MKILKGFALIVFVLLVIIVLIVSCSDTEEEPAAEPEEVLEEAEKPEDEVAWKLAAIKTDNRNLPDSDPLVYQFADFLDSLESKTEHSRTEIGDMVVKAWQILREEVNPDEDLLSVIRDLDASIPDDLDIKMNLPEVAAAYITLRQNE